MSFHISAFYHYIDFLAYEKYIYADIQPLINEGASKPDLAASIFQAVVNQTISGLACGKPIRGNVAFLGGPLHFLDQLRETFIRTLKLDEEHTIVPNNSHLFAAIGSALSYKENETMDINALIEELSHDIKMEFEVARLEPLFDTEEEYKELYDYIKVKGKTIFLSYIIIGSLIIWK